MDVRLKDIFWLFLKVGSVLFGGGYVLIPMLKSEVVEKRGWITLEELVEFYAISQCIPGINAPDVAMFVGYKLRGKRGALVAGFAVILVPVILIVALAAIISTLSHVGVVKGALWGIGLGIIVLLSLAVRAMWPNSIIDKFTLFLFALVFLATVFVDFSPLITIISAITLGVARGFLMPSELEEAEE